MKNSQLKRILYEQKKYMYNFYEYDININNNIIAIHSDCYLFNFHIPDYYPFKPPKLMIRNKEYVSKFIRFYCYLNNFIKKYLSSSYSCLCCRSMLCNWSPQNTLQDIMNEFKIFELEKNNICNLYIFSRNNHIDNDGKFNDLIIQNICDFCI
tara:strand:- start:2499 stop:2957 length:459 start_codon:yes stop_codon:yes gene_type:complete